MTRAHACVKMCCRSPPSPLVSERRQLHYSLCERRRDRWRIFLGNRQGVVEVGFPRAAIAREGPLKLSGQPSEALTAAPQPGPCEQNARALACGCPTEWHAACSLGPHPNDGHARREEIAALRVREEDL
jgi:hypothetical protein